MIKQVDDVKAKSEKKLAEKNYLPCADTMASQAHFDMHVQRYKMQKAIADGLLPLPLNSASNQKQVISTAVQLNSLHRMRENNPEIVVPANTTLPETRTDVTEDEFEIAHQDDKTMAEAEVMGALRHLNSNASIMDSPSKSLGFSLAALSILSNIVDALPDSEEENKAARDQDLSSSYSFSESSSSSSSEESEESEEEIEQDQPAPSRFHLMFM